ncbi:MAG TPA: methyltransferase domain-containing protein [Hyphomicrobiaceae bacterium]|nr:methyltransferase domain-containing protein [Hyphomicrobiaceae bacterium]
MSDRTGKSDVARYYDFIYLWTQLTNRFGAFRVPQAHTIHRMLVDPETGSFDGETIHRLIARHAKSLAPVRALDAGCGYGGTCMAMSKLDEGHWQGITINRTQVRVAARNAKALGLDGKVAIGHGSYDAPLSQTYNLIYGIESLVHSVDPSQTIANLAKALDPGGLFIIIDDMPVEDVPAAARADLEMFKASWRCPVMPTAAGWQKRLTGAGLEIAAVDDLSPLSRPGTHEHIERSLAEVARRRRWMAPLGMSMVTDAQVGGLVLERLSRDGAVRYMMIVARRPR